MTPKERKNNWIEKNNKDYRIPGIQSLNFWGTEDNRVITVDSQDQEPKYLSPLIESLESLVGDSSFAYWFRCRWFGRLALLLAFPKELSQKEKEGHKEFLFNCFCLNYWDKNRKNTQYNLSPESIEAIQSISKENIGSPHYGDFVSRFKKALFNLPQYQNIQEEFTYILNQLAQEAQKEPLKGYLQTFKELHSLPKIKQRRRKYKKECNENLHRNKYENLKIENLFEQAKKNQ